MRWSYRLGLTIGLTVLPSARPLSSQVVYSVFPANASATVAGQPTGHDGKAQISLVVRDSTIEYLVNEIARQAHLRVFYNHGPMFARRVSVHIADATPAEALKTVLRGTGLGAKLTSDGETVVISTQAVTSGPDRTRLASGTVIGQVRDSASGVGLGGATVRVEGTKLSVVTSDSGRFTLKDVPAGDQVLSVRLFGYRPVERPVTIVDSTQIALRIVMAAIPTVLSGVYTTATGTQRKVEVGNDITTLNVDSIRQVAPITSVTDLLETRVPGLTVLHSDGVPGDPSRIRVRGASSITGNNDPIVIVDGIRVYASQSDGRNQNLGGEKNSDFRPVKGANAQGAYAAPSPLDQIDPNSIETIEVLKGPSASALYGSDAASGVIVITTKHGRAGPAHWEADLGAGVNWEPGQWPVNYYRFGEGILFYKNPGSALCDWYDVTCHVDSVVAFQALNDPRYTVFSKGHNQTASLTVSGGVPTLTYSLTGSAAGDVGLLKLPGIEERRYEQFYGPIPGWMVRPDNYQTWGVNGSLKANPTPAVDVTVASSLFNGTQQQSSLQGAILQLEGVYIDPTVASGTPLIQNEMQRATDAQLTSTNTLNLGWRPVPWLPLTAIGGVNTIQRQDATLIPFGVNNENFGNLTKAFTGDTTGYYSVGHGTSQDKTLTVGTTIPVRLVTAAVGGNLEEESTTDVMASTNQLAPGVTVPTTFPINGCGGSCSAFSQATTAWSTYGWYVEPRLNVASKFFVSPGFRLDGGSASGAQAGLTGFPKIDLSYVAVDQSHPRGWLTLLRPRLAFGYAGTQPGPTEKLRLFNVGGGQVVTLNDSTTAPLVILSNIGNTKLRPERSEEVEGGFDAELWHGRFSTTYTLYNKTRHDAIIGVPVAASVNNGAVQFVNIGEVRNTGTELTMNAQLFESRAFAWTVGGNISNDNNRVLHLEPGQSTIFLGNGERIEAGYPLFSQFVRPIVAFADANHDGIVEPSEIRVGDSAVYVGRQEPKYQLNLNTGVTLLHGTLAITATFAYQDGLTQLNAGAANSGIFALIPNAPGTTLATQAAIAANLCEEDPTKSCLNSPSAIGQYQTVNTFRFNDLSINYTVPRTLSRWFRVPRVMLALQGSNLGLHTNYRGIDPNVNAFSTVYLGDQTADNGQIPEPRTWWLKLTLGN